MRSWFFRGGGAIFGLAGMAVIFWCGPVGAGNAQMGFVPGTSGQEATENMTHDKDPSGLCPQTRGTEPAPVRFQEMTNPLEATPENIKTGEDLFQRDARPIPCATCHGFKGNGMGVIFQRMKPYPRDFTCFQTMDDISDGQLFWIIRTGSHGTRMKGFKHLSDHQTWSLVLYIRHLAR